MFRNGLKLALCLHILLEFSISAVRGVTPSFTVRVKLHLPRSCELTWLEIIYLESSSITPKIKAFVQHLQCSLLLNFFHSTSSHSFLSLFHSLAPSLPRHFIKHLSSGNELIICSNACQLHQLKCMLHYRI